MVFQVLYGTQKHDFDLRADTVVWEGRDLYEWLFKCAPPGRVVFTIDCAYGRGELLKVSGRVWFEEVWNPLIKRVERIRRVSVDLLR